VDQGSTTTGPVEPVKWGKQHEGKWGEGQESAQKLRLPPPEELQLLIIRELFIQIKCHDTSSIYIHGCHVTRFIYIRFKYRIPTCTIFIFKLVLGLPTRSYLLWLTFMLHTRAQSFNVRSYLHFRWLCNKMLKPTNHLSLHSVNVHEGRLARINHKLFSN